MHHKQVCSLISEGGYVMFDARLEVVRNHPEQGMPNVFSLFCLHREAHRDVVRALTSCKGIS